MFLFYLARKGGEVYLGKHTLTGRGKRLREWFQEYGLVTVFIPALLPIPLPMKVFVLCAGALGTRPLSFIVVVVAARVPRYLGLAFLGSQLRDDAGPWLKDHAPQILIFAAVLMAALFALVKLAHRYRRPASPLQ
jgi:membrane protein YqaA with SNARE-associated domain